MENRTVDILARFLPRSGESRDVGRSVDASDLMGPGMIERVEAVVPGQLAICIFVLLSLRVSKRGIYVFGHKQPTG
jgi:hypothetical protein